LFKYYLRISSTAPHSHPIPFPSPPHVDYGVFTKLCFSVPVGEKLHPVASGILTKSLDELQLLAERLVWALLWREQIRTIWKLVA